jgi:SAM-dependent methyltransferase
VSETCPLCASDASVAYAKDRRRRYLQCGHCALVFIPPSQRLSADEERAQYDLHSNAPTDAGYRRFLDRLAAPLCARRPPPARGLDFGAGPGPTLSVMLTERGYDMAIYDPFYAPDPAPLSERWDFICATEVVEHLFEPGRVLAQLWSCLRPGGYLGIMTKLVRDRAAFAQWHYKNDPTHVCFFSEATFRWWAETQRADCEWVAADALLLRKPADCAAN